MKTEQPDLTELVFAGKHKAYGAYALRQSSGRHTGWGFLMAAFLVVGGFGGPWLWYKIQARKAAEERARKPIRQKKVVSYSELSAPPPIELVPPPTQQVVQTQKASVKFLVPVAKPDEEVPDDQEVPTLEEMATVDPGTSTVEGDSLVFDEPEEVIIEEVVTEEPIPEPEKVYTFTEQMPEFPGGEAALTAFIYENIQYPIPAQENHLEGMVMVQFVIGSDGYVRDIQVVRDIGGGCDEEVVRVIRLLPRWEPGVQNDKPVPVRFVMPVRFKLDD